MREVIKTLKSATEFVLNFLKNFSIVLLKDKIKIITLIIGTVAFLIILISTALN